MGPIRRFANFLTPVPELPAGTFEERVEAFEAEIQAEGLGPAFEPVSQAVAANEMEDLTPSFHDLEAQAEVQLEAHDAEAPHLD